jgi:hypothetical protein
MANWMSADELAGRFMVGPERLSAFADRGNLPRRKLATGEVLFDADIAARYFRSRTASLIVTHASDAPSLGVLGVTKLGREPSMSSRGQRHRPASSAVFPVASSSSEHLERHVRATG